MNRESLSMFDPSSPQGAAIRDLAFVVLAIAAFIMVVVEGVLLYSIIRFRKPHAQSKSEPPQVYGSMAIEVAWTVAPVLIIFVLILVAARTEWEVRPSVVEPKTGDKTLFVTVIGRQWWWEYRYEYYNGEKLGFITANELHVPAGDAEASRPVRLALESADVCHSYWVPRLAGKTDLLPGRTNHMFFETSERGLFLGQCAEFCGTQHAKMLLRVQVDAPADFEAWFRHEQRDASTPAEKKARAGYDVFFKQSCVNCHRIRGTTASGTYAPDLTHLMTRRTLASGIVPNTPENLRAWVRDPQKLKPGCLMPAFGLSDGDVDAIVEYLRTLD